MSSIKKRIAFASSVVGLVVAGSSGTARAQAKPPPLPPPSPQLPAPSAQPSQPTPLPPPSPAAATPVPLPPPGGQPGAQSTYPVQPSAPPPAYGVQPAYGAQPGAPPPPPGTVRLHFRLYRDKGSARVYHRAADGRYGLLCMAPCTADVPAGDTLRITWGDHEEDPHDMPVAAGYGQEVEVEVKGPSVGPVIGGAIMMGVGGASILSGLILVAISDIDTLDGRSNLSLDTMGYVFIGVGAGLAVGGLVWLIARSHEPRVEAWTYKGEEPARYDDRDRDRDRRRRKNRAEMFLGDEALARPRDPMLPLGPAPTPLRWGFAF